jgi:hypothetical protein
MPDGKEIALSSLPLTLLFEDLETYKKASKEDKEEATKKAEEVFKFYQVGVLFHEFFHTLET